MSGALMVLLLLGVSKGEDDASVLLSELEKGRRVLAVTALDICRREPAELRSPAS